jgi:hypothetical protein
MTSRKEYQASRRRVIRERELAAQAAFESGVNQWADYIKLHPSDEKMVLILGAQLRMDCMRATDALHLQERIANSLFFCAQQGFREEEL